MIKCENLKICVLGLGYVGLPLALEFAKKRKVVAFDINKKRVNELNKNFDVNNEISSEVFKSNKNIKFISDFKNLNTNCYIITAPTPIDEFKQPNLSFLRKATEMVGKVLKINDIVIYESTVFPGCTEEFCVPILEKFSNLKYNQDFFCGYSPERVNPGINNKKLNEIKKITSGSTSFIAKIIDNLYSEIISAGTHLVKNIKIAEAAKVIENTQRDLNIALINELSIIFNKLDIDTEEVLKAAETKWNFHKYRPGLVGGHCIGVDPYYLTYKSAQLGYIPEIILSGRRLNNSMSSYVIKNLIEFMIKKNITIKNSNILILGLTFKENCNDLRNSKVFDIVYELKNIGANIDVYDPLVNKNDLIDINLVTSLKRSFYDAIIIALAHQDFEKFKNNKLRHYCKSNGLIFDLKHLLKIDESDFRL